AASRGHNVTSLSRSEPQEPVEGVRYEVGNVSDVAARVIEGADVVVAALSPRGEMEGRLVDVYGELARLTAKAGGRYLQVGGFSSLRPAPGLRRVVEGDIPEEYRAEALEVRRPGCCWRSARRPSSTGSSSAPPAATDRSLPGSAPVPTGSAARSPCSTTKGTRTSPVRTSRSPSSTRSRTPAITESTSASPTDMCAASLSAAARPGAGTRRTRAR